MAQGGGGGWRSVEGVTLEWGGGELATMNNVRVIVYVLAELHKNPLKNNGRRLLVTLTLTYVLEIDI